MTVFILINSLYIVFKIYFKIFCFGFTKLYRKRAVKKLLF